MKPATLKCAVYTRKSTERGLEQDFNTLDAQREACLAYIASQKSEGWLPVKHLYDDGGYSGGSMDRPALNLLLEDIKAGQVNVVVVYKIDRLTRSLTDFAKLVEVFDQYGVSFVSVTQSFNTTTSMGRLTLNVLLSFAQFEREVIGERIRDKIAASKKKGMWMGGHPMLGYDIVERQLVVNRAEAESIRYLFDRYLELKTIKRLQADLEAKGITSKTWTSRAGRVHVGKPYGYGALHHLLSNPVYAGCIGHRGEIHEGQHEAIIPKEKWQQVQDLLQSNAVAPRGHKKQSMKNILKGKIFGADGMIYTPVRTNRHGRHYRYYVRRDVVQGQKSKMGAHARLPAHEIEGLVLNAIVTEMKEPENLAQMLGVALATNLNALVQASGQGTAIGTLHRAVQKAVVGRDCVTIDVAAKDLAACIDAELGIVLSATTEGVYRIEVPFHTLRARRGGAVVMQAGDGSDPLDLPKSKLESLVKGVICRDKHFRGNSFVEIAKEYGCSRSFIISLIGKSLEFG